MVEVLPFDDGETNKSYLVRYKNRYWKVSETVGNIVLELINGKNIDSIKKSIKSEGNLKDEDIDHVINFLKKQGLIDGYDEPKNKGHRNKLLWGRLTILTPNIVNNFKILSHLFNRYLLYIFSILSVIWLIVIIFKNNAVEVAAEIQHLSIPNLVGCYSIMTFIGLFHELGHSSALMRFEEEPGRIGVGVYFIMPVFFSDVTNAWKLKRYQRFIVDFGGMYFQLLTMLSLYICNFFIKSSLLNLAVILSALQILSNLNPFIKLDGYWMLCDILGITNIKHIIIKLITNPFKRKTQKSMEVKQLHKYKKIIIYVYLLMATMFLVYFGTIFINSFIISLEVFSSDIMRIINGKIVMESIDVNNIIRYVSSRFTSFIVILFVLRMVVVFIKWLINAIIRRNSNVNSIE